LADPFITFIIFDWTDLVIENSSFYRNSADGMFLSGYPQNPGEYKVTVVGSQFIENGGGGVWVQGVDGTIISSQINSNSVGFVGLTGNFLKLNDVSTYQRTKIWRRRDSKYSNRSFDRNH
jgi:hypothetical protein